MSKRIIAVSISSALIIGCSVVPSGYEKLIQEPECENTTSQILSSCQAYQNTDTVIDCLIKDLNTASTSRSVSDLILLSAAVFGLAGAVFDRHIDWVKGSSLTAIGTTGFKEYLVPEVKIDNLYKAIRRLSCVRSTSVYVLGAEKIADELLKEETDLNTQFDNIHNLHTRLVAQRYTYEPKLQAEVEKIFNDQVEDSMYFIRFKQRAKSAGYKVSNATKNIFISLISDNISSQPDVRKIIEDMKKQAQNQSIDEKDAVRTENRKKVNSQDKKEKNDTPEQLSDLINAVNKYNKTLKEIAFIGDSYTRLDEDLIECKIMQ
ncbi:hypothetical protein [Vibrio proteolyticus]